VIRALLFLLLALPAWAQVAVPPLKSPVTDLTGTLTREQVASLEQMLHSFEARAAATSVKLDAAALNNPETFKKFEQAQSQLSSALSRLLVVVEKYPDLKANQNFQNLQAQLEGTENRIAVARKRYIESVATYNTAVRSFPENLTAKYLLGLEVRPTFSADEGAQKPPAVKF